MKQNEVLQTRQQLRHTLLKYAGYDTPNIILISPIRDTLFEETQEINALGVWIRILSEKGDHLQDLCNFPCMYTDFNEVFWSDFDGFFRFFLVFERNN